MAERQSLADLYMREREDSQNPRRRVALDASRPAWEALAEADVPADEILLEQNRVADAQARAEAAQRGRDTSDARTLGGIGFVTRPLVNTITDPDRRQSVADAAVDAGTFLFRDVALPIAFGQAPWLPSDQEVIQSVSPGNIQRNAQQAVSRENVEAIPGRIGQATQATGNALTGAYDWVSGQADPEAFPEGDFVGGVGTLARDYGPDLARAVTYGPWEDERNAQRQLDEQRALGNEEETNALADEANLQTLWAGANAAFAPADVPALIGGLRAVNPLGGAIGRGAARSVAERSAEGAPRAFEGAPQPQGAVVDVEATPVPAGGAIGGEQPLMALRTPEQRQEWAPQAVVHQPADNMGGDTYGFRGPNDAQIAVSVSPSRTGRLGSEIAEDAARTETGAIGAADEIPSNTAPDAGPVQGERLPDGYRIDERGNMTYTRPEGPPSRLYHGTTAEVDEFAPGSHFGTAEAANRRLADNAPNAEGARVYAVDAPQGNYVRVTDAGDAWNRADYWLEMARNRSPRNDAEANLFNAIRRDQDLRGLRDEALYARLDQHFRDNGFSGAIYANRWEGGESVFLPGRLSPRTAPDGGPVQAGNRPLEFNGLKSEWNQNEDGYVDLYHSGPEEVAGEFRPNTFFSSYADYNAEQFGRSEWPVMRARARIQRPYDITEAEEAAFMRADPALIERARSQGYDALRMEDASGGFEVIPLGRVERVNPSRSGPNGGPVQAGFNLEVGSRGERTYTAPLNESFDLEVLVGSADERSVVHWGVIPRKNNARTDNLNQTARSRLATRSMREIERILASDAAQFQPRAYHFLPKPEQRAIIESMSRRLREAGYAPNHPNEYAMQFDRTGPNAGPPRDGGGNAGAIGAGVIGGGGAGYLALDQDQAEAAGPLAAAPALPALGTALGSILGGVLGPRLGHASN